MAYEPTFSPAVRASVPVKASLKASEPDVT
jgi:hypothetical protein